MQEINAHLESQSLRLREGTIVDASIIEAPSSTKNLAGERDPEMHQTKKGNQWHFGMKVHVGVDADTGLVHSMSATAANVHDVTESHYLLHGGETMVWCDAGYQGVHNRELKVDWRVAMRPGKRRKLEPVSEEAVAEKEKASVRAKSLPPTAIGGGASLSEGEADIRLWESALPGIGEEHAATGIVAGVWQPDDRGGSTGVLTRRPAGPNPSVGRLWTRYSPARGEIMGEDHQVARTSDASHTRIPAQERKDRQSRPLFRASLMSL